LYYLIEKHVWAKPIDGGLIRIGMNTVAGKLSGGKLAAVTIKARAIGQEVAQGKSVATVESSKFVGPVPAPVTGILVRGNDKLATTPNLAISDPYGEGWIAEIKPVNWEAEKGNLATGAAGLAAYKAQLEADGISCEK
jgi:glycine cleavage system H protein